MHMYPDPDLTDCLLRGDYVNRCGGPACAVQNSVLPDAQYGCFADEDNCTDPQ